MRDAEKILWNIKEIVKGMTIHCEQKERFFYELSNKYMLILEVMSKDNENLHAVYVAPGYAKENVLPREQHMTLPLHQHNYYELMYVLKGNVVEIIEDRQYSYTEGDCCILNTNIRHVEKSFENAEIIFLGLSQAFLLEIMEADICLNADGKLWHNKPEIYKMISEDMKREGTYAKECWEFLPITSGHFLAKQMEKLVGNIIVETTDTRAGFYPIVIGQIIRIFKMLSDESSYQIRKLCPQNKKDEHIFLKVQEVLKGSSGQITRKELEAAVNYEAGYINHIVKKLTGKNLTEYKRLYIMKEAARLFVETNEDISEIIYQLGFTNRSYFYRIFKEVYGLTPRKYRETYQPKSIQ